MNKLIKPPFVVVYVDQMVLEHDFLTIITYSHTNKYFL